MTMSNAPTFRVLLQKEQLVFSSAHFITFAGDICECVHGHNYGVRAEVEGPLDENRYVIDFIAFRDSLAGIVKQLDHHMLLPTKHAMILVEEESDGFSHARIACYCQSSIRRPKKSRGGWQLSFGRNYFRKLGLD
jgi:6-pyruvoyl-tetrahydropterin synthase